MRVRPSFLVLLTSVALAVAVAPAAAPAEPGQDVRLTHDEGGGYVSNYTAVTGTAYTDATLTECGQARGRQNEPSVAIDPRNPDVMVGSSNDYCGVYNDGVDTNGAPIASGPVWLGYYRSTDGGATFSSSLVPGYPDDESAYAELAHIRTASAGDPVLAWDRHGRLFAGAESSDDPAGSKKGFGDVWVATYENPAGPDGDTTDDGLQFVRSEVVARGASAPVLIGKFNDKTAIEVDRTAGSCDGNVYFAWSRFTNFQSNIYLSRSTDHGVTWSQPRQLTPRTQSVQVPEITVTGNGHVYVTWIATLGNQRSSTDAVQYARSTDCGATFGPVRTVVTFEGYAHQDGASRDCGDPPPSGCPSGYTFFRADTTPRAATDQDDKVNEHVYIVYDAAYGPDVPTGSTYGMVGPGTGSLSAVYYTRLDGATGEHTTPVLVDEPGKQHQLFPDIAVNGGTGHVLWWDSRNDTSCADAESCARQPVGNTADRHVVPSLDTYATTFPVSTGPDGAAATRLSSETTNPNYEQFADRTVPFAGVARIQVRAAATWRARASWTRCRERRRRAAGGRGRTAPARWPARRRSAARTRRGGCAG